MDITWENVLLVLEEAHRNNDREGKKFALSFIESGLRFVVAQRHIYRFEPNFEDCLHDLIVRFAENELSITARDIESPKNYCLRALRNRIIDAQRKRKPVVDVEACDESVSSQHYDTDPEQSVENLLKIETVDAHLNGLEIGDRVLIKLGLAYREFTDQEVQYLVQRSWDQRPEDVRIRIQDASSTRDRALIFYCEQAADETAIRRAVQNFRRRYSRIVERLKRRVAEVAK